MNKVLITGLGVGKDLGICEACNLNFTWLANKPSIILWADKLCIPQTAYDLQIKKKKDKSEKVIGLFLEMAENHGLINKLDLSSMYQKTISEQLYKKVIGDSQALLNTFPEVVKKGDVGVPDEILIGKESYCGALMSSIYAGIVIAEDIGANCLFSDREHNFLKYLYGLDSNRMNGHMINNVYTEIFSLYMPESLAVHNYAFSNEQRCMQCMHYTQCKKNYLTDTEKALDKMFIWREYDELQQAKEEINKLILLKNDIYSQQDIDDIAKKFKERQTKINRNINKRFPKIERWTKMIAVLATPITIVSAVTGNIPVTIGSAVATGIVQGTEKILELYKSKNNWVGFVNNMKNDMI